MSNKPTISKCVGREILDSRGNPTVETTVFLTDGTVGVASVPSGASKGEYEALELRDGDKKRYHGMGVLNAVNNVNNIISPALCGMNASDQSAIDKMLCDIDRTENKSNLGANATLSVSIASARASANFYRMPLYKYLGGIQGERLPLPMFNIINGGKHANNNIEIQEFMIVPICASSFSEALRIGSEIYHTLGNILKENKLSTMIADEGGYAPDLSSDEQAIELIKKAVLKSGYSEDEVRISIDCASSTWYNEASNSYLQQKRELEFDSEALISYIEKLVENYNLYSVEDPLDEDDYKSYEILTKKLSKKTLIIGDDLFVTNPDRLRYGISHEIANAILIKPNQIGTLTETKEVINIAKDNEYKFCISHRSGETEDTTIADLAVAFSAPFIKAGAPCRSERLAKYNRLLRIESAISGDFPYGERTIESKLSRFAFSFK